MHVDVDAERDEHKSVLEGLYSRSFQKLKRDMDILKASAAALHGEYAN